MHNQSSFKVTWTPHDHLMIMRLTSESLQTQAPGHLTTIQWVRCPYVTTTRKLLIDRNTFCGALKLGSSIEIFLWRMEESAPQKSSHFCGAWRKVRHRKAVISVAHLGPMRH